MEQEILKFIKQFKNKYPNEMEYCFLNGDCYYFALILTSRFENSIIMYHQIDNHFIVEIEEKLYDIRGEITTLYKKEELIKWEDLKEMDILYYNRVVRDCIMF